MLGEQSYLSYFTPRQMTHEMLEAILVKQDPLLQKLTEKVAQSVLTQAKHHTLLLGPRGIGKSYITALTYHRVKALPELRGKIAIAFFAEEEWGVSSLADLFLVILKALEQEHGGLKERIAALYRLPVREIEGRAGALIREFVGDRTLLILAENLDEIFRGLGRDGQWAFRSFLSERPFVTILATTQSLFAGVSDRDAAFHGFFQPIYLHELTAEEATELLKKAVERRQDAALAEFLKTPQAKERVQAVHDLAGGHPRIYLLFAHLLTAEGLDELVTPFMQLLDELTPYYQSRMLFLSPQQRKIVEFLCTARGAATVKEIAAQNLITTQSASAQLDRLEEMGYLRRTAIGRESWYELREPLLRMVIELKRGRGEPIRLIVDFLRRWYSREEREERLACLTPEKVLTKEYLLASLDLGLAIQDKGDLDRAKPLWIEFSECVKANQFVRATSLCAAYIERKGRNCTENDWLIYWMLLWETKRFDAALAVVNVAPAFKTDNPKLLNIRGFTHLYQGDWNGVLADTERIFTVASPLQQGEWMKLCCVHWLEKGEFGVKVPAIVNIFTQFNVVRALGGAILLNIPYLLKEETTQQKADEHLAAWQSLADLQEALAIPIRLLAAAAEWKRAQDVRVLMTLPIEERRALEAMLPKEAEAE